ncbi:cadherin-7 isoform X4 [Mastomys coucha]|uniref:cadherin-7 isoform X4 n=1 Tax=Mastomys coucha TaxID=35658 RepID=UPI001261D6F2|nr:cadherin-7 isoform X4 [Mastomys coucha]
MQTPRFQVPDAAGTVARPQELITPFLGNSSAALVTSSSPTLYKLLSLDSQLTHCRRQERRSQLELCLFSCQGFFLTQEKGREKKAMKLGKVELCHFLQLIALFLCFSGMSQAELPKSRSKPYFQSGKSRTKRSWVWNQFFVLEEYMGSDPLYVGKAKDMVGQNGGLSGTTSVTVTLTDVNDNPPRFPRRSYQYNVPESLPVASVVARIKAADADIGVNAEMEYKIVDGDGLGIFKISADKDTQEGIITIQKELDFEAKTSYTLRIEAANRDADPRFLSLGPFSDTTTVKIIVEDVDEPPVFSSPLYPMEVSEATQVGHIIGTVAAHDPDSSNSPVRYSIDRNTDLERYFNIDANSGVITTAKSLDRETNPVHNITVLALESQNPSQVGRGYVAITILDINDNAPEFAMDYETTVCENAQPGQVIQKISAVDKDEPSNGHQFYFSLTTDMTNNHNFSLKDNKDNTASILTRRNGFRRQEQSVYYLPIFIVDSGSPSLSSTNTLTIRVCDCDSDGIAQTCNAEAYVLPAGLSTGALIAILACVLTLLVLILLIVTMRRRKKEPLIFDEERDIRENIVRYDDEGGGEEDTEAFDMAALRNLNVIRDSKTRRDVTPEIQFLSRPTFKNIPDNVIFREFIWERLKEADVDPGAPPYDSLQTYAFEGNGSVAESLSSLDSISSNSDQNYDYLSDWGPRFKRLAEMYGNGQESLYS